MSARYLIPAESGFSIEETIKRSRFIAVAGHAADPAAAKRFILSVQQAHPDATHHCWAYAAGPPGDTAKVGYSDAGEPKGTAGKPMLHVLLRGEVGEIVCVAVRYFGGVKLGANGLVRAYAGVTANALSRLPVREKIVPVRYEALLSYGHVAALKRALAETEGRILAESYGQKAEFTIELPLDQADLAIARLREATNGGIILRLGAESLARK